MKVSFNESKMLKECVVGAVFALIIAGIMALLVSPILTALTGAIGFAMAIQLGFAAMFLMFALKIHKGKENIPQDLVNILIVMAVASIIRVFVPQLTLAYETTLAGMVMLLAIVYLGLSGAKVAIKKLKI